MITLAEQNPETYERLKASRIDYSRLPEHMQGAARRYIERGITPGDFLTAVICNDLVGAIQRADDVNTAAMRDWVMFFYNDAPSGCWGSSAAMDDWIAYHRAENGHGDAAIGGAV